MQLRMRSACPKLRETDLACERQLDVLLESHPARGTPQYDRFRKWALGVAQGPILQSLLRSLAFDLPKGGSSRQRR